MAGGLEEVYHEAEQGGCFICTCNLCGNDFSIASGGVHEVKQRVATIAIVYKRHTELAKGAG